MGFDLIHFKHKKNQTKPILFGSALEFYFIFEHMKLKLF